MAYFTSIQKHSFRHFFCKRNSIILLLLLIMSLALLQTGIQKSKKLIEQEILFNKLEKNKISFFINYRFYGIYGIRLLFAPNDFSILAINSSIINDLNAFIDSGERLNVGMQLIGRNLFKQKKFGFMDFSGVFFYLFTLVFCFYGFEMVIHKQYLKTLASIGNKKRSFFFMLLANVILIGLVIAGILCLAIILAALNSISIPIDRYLLVFFLEILGLTVFFFLLGQALGKIKPMAVSVIFIIISWVFIIFVLPTIVNGVVEARADMLEPQYKLSLMKMQKLSDYEKFLKEKEGKASDDKVITDSLRDKLKDYLNIPLKEILSMESAMHQRMMETATFYHWLSMFFPSTQYVSVTEELSSMGYLNILDFYLSTIRLKETFVAFILNKVYFENFSTIVPFLTDGENVYHATPRVPGTFIPGLIINVFYIILFIFLNYTLFKKTIFEPSFLSNKELKEQQELHLNYGNHVVLKIGSLRILNRMYTLFSGEKVSGGNGMVTPRIYLGTKEITEGNFKESFLFICSPNDLPGEMLARDFFVFIGDMGKCSKEKREQLANSLGLKEIGNRKIRELTRRERAALLLMLVRVLDRKVYLMHDIVCGLGREFTEKFKGLIEELTARGSLVIYLTKDSTMTVYSDDEFNGFIDQTVDWNSHVDQYKIKE